jgi:hypothetical protein
MATRRSAVAHGGRNATSCHRVSTLTLRAQLLLLDAAQQNGRQRVLPALRSHRSKESFVEICTDATV